MVMKSKDIVRNVVASMAEARSVEMNEMQMEFEASSQEIGALIESWKRKIIEAGSITNYKRSKNGNESGGKSKSVQQETENINPNIIADVNAKANKNGQEDAINIKQHGNEDKDEDLNLDLNSMKKEELRQHLRDRNLDDQGLKKTLQLRLQAYLDEQKREQNCHQKEPIPGSSATGIDEVDDVQVDGATAAVAEAPVADADVDADVDVEMSEFSATNTSMEDGNKDVSMADDPSVSVSHEEEEQEGVDTNIGIEKNYHQEPGQELESEPEPDVSEFELQPDAEHVNELESESMVVSESGSTKSKSPKKNIGKKILKATSKIFSPNKSKKAQKKEMKKMENLKDSGVDHEGEYNHKHSSMQQDSVPVPVPVPVPVSVAGITQVVAVNDMNGAASINIDCPTSTSANNAVQPEPNSKMDDMVRKDNSDGEGEGDKTVMEMSMEESADKLGELRADSSSTASTARSTGSDHSNSKVKQMSQHQQQQQQQAHSALPVVSTPAMPTKIAGKVFSSSTAQAKKREMDEARKARMEKIRNKVKKNQESAVKAPPMKHMSAVKESNASTSSHDSADDRKKAIAAKLRQKLAQGKQHEVAAATPTVKQQAEKEVLSPRDTYELSDRDDSDSGSESDESENRSSNKKIPNWALRQNLLPALERQFLDGPHKLDPDKIFPEVSTCDLEAIFGQKKKRYKKRASTGDWRTDRVTASEKLVYKRRMGFK